MPANQHTRRGADIVVPKDAPGATRPMSAAHFIDSGHFDGEKITWAFALLNQEDAVPALPWKTPDPGA